MAVRAIRHMLTAFLAGEISPLLTGRVDSQQYAYGLETCENFVPMNEGPLVKRPGFEMIRPAAATATWLSGFRFSITQEYAIEWSNATLRFYTNGGRIETAGVPLEVTVPYTAAEAPYVSTQQSYDRLYMDHPKYPPARLSRTGATTFTYAVSPLINGPFADQNTDKTVGVTASATTGSGITITATGGAIFRSGHVGSFFRMEALDFSTIKVWEANMTGIVIGDLRRSDGKVYRAQTAGNTGSNAPTHTEGTEWDGSTLQDVLNLKGPYGVQWLYVHDRFGIVKITAIGGGGTTATADVLRTLPGSLTSVASWRWAYGLFSDDAGYPQVVINWQGRQVHLKDFDLTASVAGDFLNFQTFTSSGVLAADLSFRRRLAASDPPLWALEDRSLLVGTASRELAIGPLNSQAAVSGDNIKSEPQSFYGSEPVWPLQLGSEAVFIERGGRRLRGSGYDFQSDRYQAQDLTAAARHITDSGIVQLAGQRWPFGMVHMVRADGQIAVHPLSRSEIKGFCRTVLGGGAKALSAVSIVGADGRTDELWLLIERSTPAGTVREVWKQHAWRELGEAQEQAFYVDGGAQVAASAGQTVFTGLTHLAGQAVAVLANGGVVPGMTVDDAGVLTLPASAVPDVAYTMTVGLAYTATAVTLRPAPQGTGGLLQGLRQRVVKAIVRLIETVGLIGGADGNDGYDLIDRSGNDQMDAAVPLFTGDVSVEVDQEPGREGRTRFVSADPLPATIAMMSFSIDVGEG